LCREEGLALTNLAADKEGNEEKPAFDGFHMFGVVKETGVDDEGLHTFYSKYFTFPLFRDEKLAFYDGLGGRKLKARTLFGFLWNMRSMNKRMKEQNIEGNLVGEGIVQGGVVIFDKEGKQQYAYEEDTGKPIPVDDILAAVNAVKEKASAKE